MSEDDGSRTVTVKYVVDQYVELGFWTPLAVHTTYDFARTVLTRARADLPDTTFRLVKETTAVTQEVMGD